MNKDEIIELHSDFVSIKEDLESRKEIDEDQFEKYENLGISPSDTHESKKDHEHAVYVLGELIAESISDDEFSNAGRLRDRMEELQEDIDV